MMNDRPIPLPDRTERERIHNELDVNLLVEAAAGTGKTTCLIARMIALIQEGKCAIDMMAAVTFTRKAAAEMRSRFQVELEKTHRDSSGLIHERLSNALHRIERCFIGTIHSFCGRLLRERPIEAGVDITFREIDEVEDQRIRRSVWDEYVAHLYADDEPILTELRDAGLEIGALYPTFLEMADYPDVDEWPAPPTPLPDLLPIRKVLLDYVSHMERLNSALPEDPGNDELIPQYRTILRLVQYHDLSDPVSLMKILDEFKKCKTIHKQWPGGKTQATEELERWDEFRKTVVMPLQNQWLARRYEISLRAILPALTCYERRKQREGALNFQDLLLYAAKMLKRCPQVRRYFQNRITHLLVDEFQDTDPIQAEIMMLLTSDDISVTDWRMRRPRPGSLFVVGDPKQSIYRFRRADIVTYNQVKKIVQQNGGCILPLSANFRTDPHILDWINNALESHFPETESPYSPGYVPLQRGIPDPTLPVENKVQTILIPATLSTNEDCSLYEAAAIAAWIHREIQSGRAAPGDFLIVTYLTRNLNLYAKMLEKYQIPCQVTGGDALNQLEELRLLALCLTAIVQTWNPIALVGILRSELFGFSDPELYAFKKQGGTFSFLEPIPGDLPEDTRAHYKDVFERFDLYRRWIKTLPFSTAIEAICEHLGLFACASASPGADGRCGCLAKAIAFVRSSPDRFHSLGDVLDFFHQLLQNEIKLDGISATPPQKSVVRIMNLHKAKGLEAPIVVLADPTGKSKHSARLHIDRSHSITKGYRKMEQVNAGSFQRKTLAQPEEWDRYSEEEQNYLDAEKIRLLYVAATRCKQRLIVAQREKNNRYNPWDFFESYLTNAKPLESPPTQASPISPPKSWDLNDIQNRVDIIQKSLSAIAVPTYETSSATESIHGDEERRPAREEGALWGSLIHTLLDSSMRNPDAQLERIAERIIGDGKLNSDWRDKAIRVVRQALSSEIGLRAKASFHRFTEIPFQSLGATASLPIIEKGRIDLLFKEEDGWVLVDYKTDFAAKGDMKHLLERYRKQLEIYAATWSRLTGSPVKETGIYFTEIHRYITF